MKIVFLIPPPDLSGGIRVIASIADALRRMGHEVLVFYPRPWCRVIGRRQKIGSLLRGDGWLTIPPPPASHFDASPSLLHETGRPGMIEDRDVPDADVVVATWWETAEWAARLSARKGVKVQFIQQFEANFGQPLDRIEAVWRLPMHKIVCSQWLADLARDRFGDSNVTIVTNGIDARLFNAPERGKQPRPTVGVMYSTALPKAWGIALAALIDVRRRLPNLRVRVFGAMAPVSWLPLPQAAEFELSPCQQRLREIYASCDAWLCASGSEGYHLPPHEAMACRCPVVSTRVGGPMDLVRNGENGFLVEPFDACMLADRLVTVLSQPEPEWRRMSGAAYNTVQGYTWDDAAIRFEKGITVALSTRTGLPLTSEPRPVSRFLLGSPGKPPDMAS